MSATAPHRLESTIERGSEPITGTAETRALEQVTDHLQRRFPESSRDAIRRLVIQAHHEYDGRPIRDFVPVLVERQVNDDLARLRQASADESRTTMGTSSSATT